ncbi:MAG: aldose 1-epimerase, partial [Sphingomonadales bacterium]|nr:aldose 1-epimerase [Sphingomonadales bacterium]
MAADELVTMAAGNLRLELSPSIGGAISTFAWADGGASQPILRESHTPLEKAVDAASFPLVPYVNRIRGGRFTFRGREVRIAPNMA